MKISGRSRSALPGILVLVLAVAVGAVRAERVIEPGDSYGDVWYFGEHVDNYENGILVDHEVAWLAGVDGAKPGIWMLANPQLGDQFRNEFYPGKAEDLSTVIAVSETVQVAGRTFTGCVKNLDGSSLFQTKAHTYYCKGQGVSGTVLEVELPGPDTTE